MQEYMHLHLGYFFVYVFKLYYISVCSMNNVFRLYCGMSIFICKYICMYKSICEYLCLLFFNAWKRQWKCNFIFLQMHSFWDTFKLFLRSLCCIVVIASWCCCCCHSKFYIVVILFGQCRCVDIADFFFIFLLSLNCSTMDE